MLLGQLEFERAIYSKNWNEMDNGYTNYPKCFHFQFQEGARLKNVMMR